MLLEFHTSVICSPCKISQNYLPPALVCKRHFLRSGDRKMGEGLEVMRGSRGPSLWCTSGCGGRSWGKGEAQFIVLKRNREHFLPVLIDTRLGGDSGLPCRLRVTARTGCPLVHWDLVQTDSWWRDGSSLGSWREDRNAGSSGWQSAVRGQTDILGRLQLLN